VGARRRAGGGGAGKAAAGARHVGQTGRLVNQTGPRLSQPAATGRRWARVAHEAWILVGPAAAAGCAVGVPHHRLRMRRPG
jgi:hypothetical protein